MIVYDFTQTRERAGLRPVPYGTCNATHCAVRPSGRTRAALDGQLESRPILDKLNHYLLEIQAEVLPTSPEGRAVRYTLKNWTALNRCCEDGNLSIDNNANERDIRGVAVGRNNWMFVGSDQGVKTAAALPAGWCRTLRLV